MNIWSVQSIESSEKNFKFSILENNEHLSNLTFLQLLKESGAFRTFYNQLLSDCGFEAIFWENRPFSLETLNDSYECNLVKSTFLAGKPPDKSTFSDYFNSTDSVVTFNNLGKDTLLIVPVPANNADNFTHIEQFLREADKQQIDDFWKTVADETLQRINNDPVWLNTSGVGVFWLHARIDYYPKYYQTEEYKTH